MQPIVWIHVREMLIELSVQARWNCSLLQLHTVGFSGPNHTMSTKIAKVWKVSVVEKAYWISLQCYIQLANYQSSFPRPSGPVLAVCMCHSGTQENLNVWLKSLQETYPSLTTATFIYNITETKAHTENKQLQGNSKTPISESSSTELYSWYRYCIPIEPVCS